MNVLSDIMVDIESLSTAPDACILSIGAVRFNIETGEALSRENYFYQTIDIDSNLAAGRRIDGRTIAWWMDQSQAAQAAVFSEQNALMLGDALVAFSRYLRAVPFDRIWCRGAAFDFPAIESACRHFTMPVPWPYYAVRCQRTLEDMASADKPSRDNTPHNALDDAIYQAYCAIIQWRALKGSATLAEADCA